MYKTWQFQGLESALQKALKKALNSSTKLNCEKYIMIHNTLHNTKFTFIYCTRRKKISLQHGFPAVINSGQGGCLLLYIHIYIYFFFLLSLALDSDVVIHGTSLHDIYYFPFSHKLPNRHIFTVFRGRFPNTCVYQVLSREEKKKGERDRERVRERQRERERGG